MHRLVKPKMTGHEILEATAIHSHASRSRKLTDPSVLSAVETAEREYDASLSEGLAHRVPKSSDIAGVLNQEEAIRVYEEFRITKVGNKRVRDTLLKNGYNTKCAYCGHDLARTLDHYLPKSQYVKYAFSPLNLIPCCACCNSVSRKGSLSPTSTTDTFFHPYYDDPDDARWLDVSTSVDCSCGVSLRYTVIKPSQWTFVKYERIKYTFAKLSLDEVYASDMVSRLFEARTVLNKLFFTSGVQGLQGYFADCARVFSTDSPNNWLYIGYGNLASNKTVCALFPQWFVDE